MEIERVEIGELSPDPANVRRHPAENIEAIAASLRRWGQQKPVVVDGQNVVRAGNGTLLAARELGWTHLDVVRSELTGAEAAAYSIADNRTAELAEWEAEVHALVSQIKLDLPDLDALALGFVGIAESIGQFDVVPVPPPNIPDGEKSPLGIMTFTVTERQREAVLSALSAAKESGPFEETGNGNSNGNALARIAEAYLGAS